MDMISDALRLARDPACGGLGGSALGTPGEYLWFRLGGVHCGMSMRWVQEIRGHEPPAPVAGAPACLTGVLNLRGLIVPVVDLALLMGCPRPAPAARSELVVVKVLDGLSGRVGVVVDAVCDVLTLAAQDIVPVADRKTICPVPAIHPSPASHPSPACHPIPASHPLSASRFLLGLGRAAGQTLVLVDIARWLASADLGRIDLALGRPVQPC